MNTDHFRRITQIKISRCFPDVEPILQQIFQQHGGKLEIFEDYCLAHFPEGTTGMEILPRVRTLRVKITLPDGYEMQQYVTPYCEQSVLGFPEDDIPLEIRKKYSQNSID
jgi:hypothetical protein